MDLTFELVGRIAVWMFIAELIILVLFKKSGKQFKWMLREFTPGLNPYIKKSKYILITFSIFIIVGVIQKLTNFIDKLLIDFIGSSFLLYLIAFSFDMFFIAKEFAGLNMKNNWVKIPLFLSVGIFILAMLIKVI
ncbi:MAG: hypothetical protein ACOCUU_03040 [Nanoarchaeota archaeon]